MFISQINFVNFRNFASLDLKVDQGLIVLVGENGAGKTNFLEGLYFGASLRRFPESLQRQLVFSGASFFRVVLGMYGAEAERLEALWETTTTGATLKLSLDRETVARSRYTGAAPVISFLPQDLILLTRSPQNRRRHLDEALFTALPAYRAASLFYERALRQRNALWRSIAEGQASEKDLEVWDEQLAEHGAVMTKARKDFLDRANTALPGILSQLAPAPGRVALVYAAAGAADPGELREKILQNRAQERVKLTSIAGPHRDDFLISWDGQNVAGFLSRGQIRALTLALKIFQWQFIEESLSRPPILLLDDVFSEFDPPHQRSISVFLKSFPQAFLTTANPETLSKDLRPNQMFRVASGKITATL